MAEASSTELSPQQLIAKYRGYYFFLQMRTLILGAALLTAAAAFSQNGRSLRWSQQSRSMTCTA